MNEDKKGIATLETPCFIVDQTELDRSVIGFQTALNKNFRSIAVAYSVKTNSLPWSMMEAKRLGCYAEVVSYDEYELALRCGFEKTKIVYNGPLKSRESFLDAIQNGAIVNIDTHRELAWLQDLPKDKHYKVGIRLNVNISQVSPSDADGDNDDSRFGFCANNSEFLDAVNSVQATGNVTLAGLHIHRTSHSRSVAFYENTIEFASSVIEKYNLDLEYIDIGGGFFGIFRNKPTYQEYSDAFFTVLKKHGLLDLRVIVEPGNALVASAFHFVSRVIDVKDVDDITFAITDGSRNDVDPFFRKTDYIKEIIYNDDDRQVIGRQIVSGCTCLEYDRMFSLFNKPKLKEGDEIVYHNVGAYTMCLSPMFIRYIPNVYVKSSDNVFKLVRKKWQASEYLQNNILA